MPTFSVIMATYNRGRFIVPSINSVLAQNLQDFELIVVGDCCDDDTAEAVEAVGSAKTRWHNLSERTGGQSLPNNAGISMAGGRYIAYLGHDDVWGPGHLKALLDIFERDPVLDFAVSGTIFHGPPGSESRDITGIFTDAGAPFEHFFPPSGFGHRRDVTERVGPWLPAKDIRAPADADFVLRAAHAGMRFASTQRITVHKFAAGQRYLSYLRQSSDEQTDMLMRTAAPGYRNFLDSELALAKAGGSFMVTRHKAFDRIPKGKIAAANNRSRGLALPTLQPLRWRRMIRQDKLPRALDWQRPKIWRTRFRWVGSNPRPRVLVPYTHSGKVRMELVLAHASAGALACISLSVNGSPVAASLTEPRQEREYFEANAVFETELLQADYSVLQFDLDASQRPEGGKRGIGMAEMIIEPAGGASATPRFWQKLRSLFGRD